ncbi:hypothetical protein [Actinacidiphila oryziradicis]|uniref:HTH OST-type domain-containing protein n=1 Tax=Actinacidiphila oryziradicis TaxID=2571141 RepID=A0A4V5MXD9_9ACTN|nr:hypothetical protein [Actinacidiphila oryziradicis]TJZ99798.1 hypothetical protein FCI23_44410 [Actinacidiphila oryziradicis]
MLRTLAARRRDGSDPEDFKKAILTLVQQAHGEGQRLSSLDLGQALQTLFGMDAYSRFRREKGKGKLKPAVEALGFRTTPTRQGFDVDLP